MFLFRLHDSSGLGKNYEVLRFDQSEITDAGQVDRPLYDGVDFPEFDEQFIKKHGLDTIISKLEDEGNSVELTGVISTRLGKEKSK